MMLSATKMRLARILQRENDLFIYFDAFLPQLEVLFVPLSLNVNRGSL